MKLIHDWKYALSSWEAGIRVINKFLRARSILAKFLMRFQYSQKEKYGGGFDFSLHRFHIRILHSNYRWFEDFYLLNNHFVPFGNKQCYLKLIKRKGKKSQQYQIYLDY